MKVSLLDYVAVHWTCQAVVRPELERQLAARCPGWTHAGVLQQAAEAVAQCGGYETDFDEVDFFIQAPVPGDQLGARISFESVPAPVAILSLTPLQDVDIGAGQQSAAETMYWHRVLVD